MNPVVEGFRGLAAIMVMAHHYSYVVDDTLTHGWLHFFHNGVDLFFVITGFLFAPHLLGVVQQSARAFIIRRAFRLYPLYIISLAVAVLKDLGERDGLGFALVKHLFFLQALPIYDLDDVGFFSLIYWTLPVEVMFYALVAVALVAFRGTDRGIEDQKRTRSLAWCFGGVAALAFVLVHSRGFAPQNQTWVVWQAQLPALLLPFWFGMAIHSLRSTLRQSRAWRYTSLFLGCILLVALFFLYPEIVQSSITARPFGPFNILSGLGYALILAGCLHLSGSLGKTRARCAILAGASSYGIYLFHEWTLKIILRIFPQVTPIFQVILAFASIVLLAMVLHRTIEAPLRAYGRLLAGRLLNIPAELK